MPPQYLEKVSWMIGGEAGYGIMQAGTVFARTLMRSGSHVFFSSEYPSLIRGGNNTSLVTASVEKIRSPAESADLLVALNEETISIHSKFLSQNSGLVFDGSFIKQPALPKEKSVSFYPVPLQKLAEEAGGEKITRNSVSLGVSAGLMGLDFKVFEWSLKKSFSKKDVVEEINLKAAKLGFEFAKENFPNGLEKKKLLQNASAPEGRILAGGNEALSMGAIRAGCKFVAIYPMTPINSILSFMASKERDFNIIVKQPEDEIAGINMAVGAAHAGARAMVATSGGGFSLMVEAVGMAGMSETPVVIVLGQRGGPSTGLPTRTEQGDLLFAINASQGEFPKAVIAPGDAEECFYFAGEAFNTAEKFQTPVILLTDKFLAESFESTGKFDQNKIKIDRGLLLDEKKLAQTKGYKRYAFTENGVSPRSLPGMKGGLYRAQSYEHREDSHFDETTENRMLMVEKRMRKLKAILDYFPKPKLSGEKNAEITFVSWGSPKGAILDAIEILKEKRVKANFLQLQFLWPFPAKEVKDILSKCENPVLVENNATGQLGLLIAEQTGMIIEKRVLKYDARPFTVKYIVDAVEKLKIKK